MKIEPVALAERIESWSKRLSELGIAHWRIECVTLTDEMPDHPMAKMTVKVSTDYDSYWLYVRNSWLEEATAYELDEVIVHELLHVTMRDLDESLENAESWMPEATYDQWSGQINHFREGHIDRLARLIVRLNKRRPPNSGTL